MSTLNASNFFSRLTRAAFAGRRLHKVRILQAVEDDEYQHRMKLLSVWAKEGAADFFIAELQKRRDEHKQKRIENYKDHLAVITAMTAEAAFEEAISLLTTLKVFTADGQASEQDNES